MRTCAYQFAQCAQAIWIHTPLHGSLCPNSVCTHICALPSGVELVLAQLFHDGCVCQSLPGQDPQQHVCAHVGICLCMQCPEFGVCVTALCARGGGGAATRGQNSYFRTRVITQTGMWSIAPPWVTHMTLEPVMTNDGMPLRGGRMSTARGADSTAQGEAGVR